MKVVRARYRGQGVQVKMLADNAGPEYKRQFLHGALTHARSSVNLSFGSSEITVLASIKSSRCVVFYGANTAATPWFLVTDMGPATLLQAMTRPRVKFDWDVWLPPRSDHSPKYYRDRDLGDAGRVGVARGGDQRAALLEAAAAPRPPHDLRHPRRQKLYALSLPLRRYTSSISLKTFLVC